MIAYPQGITLGNYSQDVTRTIEKHGGKLGILELIAQNNELIQSLKKVGVLIGPNIKPLILSSPPSGISNEEYEHFMRSFARFSNEYDGNHPLTTNKALIRASVPGDWRSLVDIIPSHLSDPDIDSINTGIERILRKISENAGLIQYYAECTGVPFDKNDIHIGVVTGFNLPIVTITENPNNGYFYVDDFEGKYEGFGSKIYTDTTDADGMSIAKSDYVIRNPKVIKTKSMIQILQAHAILDPNIAYQFEFGRTYTGELVLFQIKEFAKKKPISIRLSQGFPLIADKILSGGETGYTLSIHTGINAHNTFPPLLDSGIVTPKFIILGENGSEYPLEPNEFYPGTHGIYSGDSHSGSLVHNSFRFVQQVVQAGGTALVGGRYSKSIIQDLHGKEIAFSGGEKDGGISVSLLGYQGNNSTPALKGRIKLPVRKK